MTQVPHGGQDATQGPLRVLLDSIGPAAVAAAGGPSRGWAAQTAYNGAIIAVREPEMLAAVAPDGQSMVLSTGALQVLEALAAGTVAPHRGRLLVRAIFDAQLRLMANRVPDQPSRKPAAADHTLYQGTIGCFVDERTDNFSARLSLPRRPGSAVDSTLLQAATQPETAAVDSLVSELARYPGIDREALLRRLLASGPTDGVDQLAAVVVETTLAEVIPITDQARRRDAVGRVAAAIALPLASLGAAGDREPTATGTQAGLRAAHAIGATVEAIVQENQSAAILDRILAAQASAAVAISGADHSSVNDRTVWTNGPSWAHLDGTLQYDVGTVLRPLEALARNAGRPQEPAAVRAQRRALQIVLANNLTTLAGPGRDFRDRAAVYTGAHVDPCAAALAAGLVRSAASNPSILDAYIRQLGVDHHAPDILSVTLPTSPTPSDVAADEFARGLATAVGIDHTRMLLRLNTVDAGQTLRLAARQLFDSHGLGDKLIDPDHRAAALQDIENSLGNSYAWVLAIGGAETQDYLAAVAIADQAVADGIEVAQRRAGATPGSAAPTHAAAGQLTPPSELGAQRTHNLVLGGMPPPTAQAPGPASLGNRTESTAWPPVPDRPGLGR